MEQKIYKRKILDAIERQIEAKEIIVLTGMRRVGKTTLCRFIFDKIKSKNKVFFNLENPLDQKIFEEDDYNNIMHNLESHGVIKEEKAFIFLDEVQDMPCVIKAIKYLYDHYDIKFFLTGSSSFYLKNLFPESLAGRKFIYELFPLDFEEFLVFKGLDKKNEREFGKKIQNKIIFEYEKYKVYYEQYLNYGGFPAVVLAKNKEQKILRLNDIFKSYFEKDVKILADFRDIRVFRDLILLLMDRAGSRVGVSKLASELGVTRPTIYSFLSFLEQTYFIHFVSPYTKSTGKEISKAKKIYMCDNGILNLFGKPSSGSLLENAVFLNLKKYGLVNYYQKRTGREIDFVLDGKIGLEVKKTGVKSDYKKLEESASRLNLKQKYLVTKNFSKNDYSILAQDL